MPSKQTSYGLWNQVIKTDKSVHHCHGSLVASAISIKRWTNIPLNQARTPFPSPSESRFSDYLYFLFTVDYLSEKQRNLINGCIMRFYERGTDMSTSLDSRSGNNNVKSQLPRETAVISRQGIKVQSFSEDDLCVAVVRSFDSLQGWGEI